MDSMDSSCKIWSYLYKELACARNAARDALKEVSHLYERDIRAPGLKHAITNVHDDCQLQMDRMKAHFHDDITRYGRAIEYLQKKSIHELGNCSILVDLQATKLTITSEMASLLTVHSGSVWEETMGILNC